MLMIVAVVGIAALIVGADVLELVVSRKSIRRRPSLIVGRDN